ncbi:MAG: 7,8-didemethyl-8-hydroxy-5-deazariboflavin synthase CofG [Proteobacteria bacterium]|nr:7,8-didemethyl-8-hydroxy-5-deazariboflavin synthase CofG [Pseudomonadota bacterium]
MSVSFEHSQPLAESAARDLAAVDPGEDRALAALMAAARARRDARWQRRITFSPKVFLPLTNLCRNFCDYCSFRRSPGQAGEWTMSPDQVITWLDRGRAQGCAEALFCLGDQPEDVFRSYRDGLADWGHASTVEYLYWAGERALERGLLPHTNAGVLSKTDMVRLKEVNVSLGLMLENTSPRLCQKGLPHHRAPDKRPERRLAMTRTAGQLAIPFTSGLLVGIGETRLERIDTLLAIRDLHRQFGHIQEVIVQNFRAQRKTPMADADEPDDREIAYSVAVARLILDDEISVQAPPNLNPAATELLLDAGINDLGGISPVTPDYINPGHPWPHLDALAAMCAKRGYQLRPRPPIYDDYVNRPGFLAERLREPTLTRRAQLSAVEHPGDLAPTRSHTSQLSQVVRL